MGSSTMYDTAQDLKDLIKDNWTLASQPQVSFKWEERTTGFMDDRKDMVLLSPTNENPQYFGLYGQDFFHEIYCNIDITTFQNIKHNQDIVDEIFRIVKANIRGIEYVDLMLMSSSHNNDLYRNIYNHSITVRFRKINP